MIKIWTGSILQLYNKFCLSWLGERASVCRWMREPLGNVIIAQFLHNFCMVWLHHKMDLPSTAYNSVYFKDIYPGYHCYYAGEVLVLMSRDLRPPAGCLWCIQPPDPIALEIIRVVNFLFLHISGMANGPEFKCCIYIYICIYILHTCSLIYVTCSVYVNNV